MWSLLAFFPRCRRSILVVWPIADSSVFFVQTRSERGGNNRYLSEWLSGLKELLLRKSRRYMMWERNTVVSTFVQLIEQTQRIKNDLISFVSTNPASLNLATSYRTDDDKILNLYKWIFCWGWFRLLAACQLIFLSLFTHNIDDAVHVHRHSIYCHRVLFLFYVHNHSWFQLIFYR